MQTSVINFVDLNYTAKTIAELSGDKLLVRSLFFTLQGEGPFAGFPAVFIRLAGCNRGAKRDCEFCDTSFEVEKSKLHTVAELCKLVEKHKHPYAMDKPIVVLTGGEPLLHANAEVLVHELHNRGYMVQVETNGDLLRTQMMPRALMVVSPKVNMRSRRYTKLHKEVLERADYLKVLVSAEPDHPYHKLPDYLNDFADRKGSHHVFISPVNEYARTLQPGEIASMWGDQYDRARCEANHKYAAQIARDSAYRLSIQMHAFAAIE